MKKIFIYALLAVLAFTFAPISTAEAAHQIKNIAVMTDTGHRNGTNYLICGAAADIIATDIINRINQTGRMKAPLLGETMSKITQHNMPLFYMTLLNEYKYNYNVDYVNLKRVTKNIKTDYFLMVTSGLDVQSQFLKDTWWNKLNIPGMDPVKPTYKLSTLITLIDAKTYQIVWQDLYLRDIEAHNYDLGVVQFSPSYAQLSKIKKYSKNMSEYVTNIIDTQVNPWIVPPKEPSVIDVKSKFINEGTKVYYPTVNGEVVKENFNEFKTETKKQWNNFNEKRKEKKNIENVKNTTPQNSSTKVIPVNNLQSSKPSNEPQKQSDDVKSSVFVQPTQQLQSDEPQKTLTRQEQRAKQKELKQFQNTQIQNQKEQQEFIQKQRKDKELFDSIKNNIDDMSNSLPEPEDTQEYVLPSNNADYTQQELQNNSEIKLRPKALIPAVNKPNSQGESDFYNINRQQNPTNTIQPETPSYQPLNKSGKKRPFGYYDWNIKNIYLEKIGNALT